MEKKDFIKECGVYVCDGGVGCKEVIMEYTKGVWNIRKQEENNPDSWEYDVVCQKEEGMYPSTIARDMNKVNAQLIAQSPRMAEWIDRVVKQNYIVFPEDKKKAKEIIQAITKAEGN